MEQYQADFTLDPAEPVFAGHFPGRPIFPGVLTLALVRETLRRADGRNWCLRSVTRHKLLRPLLPGDQLCVSCRVVGREELTLALDCRLALADGSQVASARLRLEPV